MNTEETREHRARTLTQAAAHAVERITGGAEGIQFRFAIEEQGRGMIVTGRFGAEDVSCEGEFGPVEPQFTAQEEQE